MNVRVMNEAGYTSALVGLSLSFNQGTDNMPGVARNLAHKQGGHNKFLESMQVWIDMTAPRYFWQQFDTYRVGTTKQSESTMHTILKRPLIEDDFEGEDTSIAMICMLNGMREAKEFTKLKQHLPESFLQRRIISTNYKVLQNMVAQRLTHKLPEWRWFIEAVLDEVEFPEFIRKGYGEVI